MTMSKGKKEYESNKGYNTTKYMIAVFITAMVKSSTRQHINRKMEKHKKDQKTYHLKTRNIIKKQLKSKQEERKES